MRLTLDPFMVPATASSAFITMTGQSPYIPESFLPDHSQYWTIPIVNNGVFAAKPGLLVLQKGTGGLVVWSNLAQNSTPTFTGTSGFAAVSVVYEI